jgi:lipopolysaccharide transport system ATP-binding protein
MGDINHAPKGHFSIHRQVKLPQILTKGIINVDLFIHHPMVEYYLKAPGCCTLECEGYQKGFGRTMNQDSCGFIGLEDLNSTQK